MHLKVRKIITGMIIMLACVVGFLGNPATMGAASAHATQVKEASSTFDWHAILPIRQLHQYAQKLNVKSATGLGIIPPCLASAVAPRCYSPQQIRTTYAIQPLFNAGIRGKGHTIVLIDFATSPTLKSDVHLYDQIYGLPDPKINVISPFSPPSVDNGGYQETAIDVETAHALAPDATIDIVLVNPATATSFQQILTIPLQATQYAVQNNLGDVISQSFGVGESCATASYLQAEHQVFAEARAKGITVLASSGDFGDAAISCSGGTTTLGLTFNKEVNLPAADPLATAVGGTTLNASVKTGKYIDETTWSNGGNPISQGGATGGGISTIFPAPDYQKGVTNQANRAIPDVAFDADPYTGVPIVYSESGGLFIIPVGGTSVGSPAWAAIVVLANQVAGHRLGFLNSALYAISSGKNYTKSFHDITTGNNTVEVPGPDNTSIPLTGYNAGPGWDAVTGIGTPIVEDLIPLLIKNA